MAASARSYRARLRALDSAIARCVARVPQRERKLVTDHDALGYFAARYGLDVVGAVFPAQSTQAQASAGDVAALERLIREQHVRAVFPDAALNGRLSERIASDTGASAAGRLFGDSLGSPGSRAGTLAGMLAANARTIVSGISGGKVTCALP